MAAKPQVLKGFRDLLPPRMRLTQHVIQTATDVFERFGFEPLSTPALEYAETLAGKSGEEADTLFYRFQDRGQREIGLRYDLTVPLARVVAMHGGLGRPFKRYQIEKVWRAERPQRGRYREFYQCDADIVGSKSRLADAEIIMIAHTALLELGFERFKIKLNNRMLLAPLAERCDVPYGLYGSLFRSIDKLDKIGASGVRKELKDAGVPASSIDCIFGMISSVDSESDTFAYIEREMAASDTGLQGVADLRDIWSHLRDCGVEEDRIAIDLSLIRGLDYYTGPIFEAVDLDGSIGSISAGGRYDGLIGAFSGQDAPAVGVSLGLERIVDLMEMRAGENNNHSSGAQVLVTVFSPHLLPNSLKTATCLRAAGLKVEMYLNADRLPNQLRYANRKGIGYCTILGPDEARDGTIVLRDMKAGSQATVVQDQVVNELKGMLAEPSIHTGEA